MTAKVKARLEKVVAKEPEFAHLLAEVAEHVLSSFGRLMASPDAARHVHEALFYYFEGYQTRDGEVLYARIERTVREAVRRAEEAGIPDAEYRIKQFILWLIERLEEAGERYRKDALKAVSTAEKTLRATAFAGFSAAALHSAYHGLYSEAVVSSVATAVAFTEVGRLKEAVEYVQRAAKALYETAKDVFEHVKVSLQKLVELFVEAVTRTLAWIDEHKAYLFLMAAVTAGAITLSTALNLWGLVELEKLAYAASAAPFVAGLADTGEKAAERFRAVAEKWKVGEDEKQKIEEIINAPQNKERPFSKLSSLKNLPPPLVKLKEALKRAEDKAKIDEVGKDAAVVAALVLYKTLINNAEAYGKWAEVYHWARGLVKEREFTVSVGDIERLREAHRRLEEVAEQFREELNDVLALYSRSGFYKERSNLLNKLKQLLEVKLSEAEELAKARSDELSGYEGVNMGTKVYAALLSAARGGIYGHAAMLLMAEGALADIVLSAPVTAYEKAGKIAERRGESVDPSRSPKGAAGWEDRVASVLLRYLLSKAVSEDLVFRHVKGGFEVFRTYGGVETRVDVLKIGKVTRSKADKEVLRRFVEEAKRTAPDLSGIKKIWQALEWFATDVSFAGKWIEAVTAHLWQAAWYVALFGEPESTRGRANVTEEGVKPNVKMRWRIERLDSIIAEGGEELKLLLGPISKQGGGSRESEGPAVKSWRELVDAINWSWVLKKVEELADKLKPWIGPEKWDDAEREGLARRMLGELALFVHFVETRRGLDDDRWREERIKRLVMTVEALSGGRIAGDYADRLARAIIYYAEEYKNYAEELIESLAKAVGVSEKEVRGVVERILSGEDPYVYCLARYCADDKIIRKFVAPALELIMLDKALNNKFDREEALLIFGEMYATALAGDGHVGQRRVELTVGGELGGGATLLRLASLHLLSQLLPDELKFNVRVYVREGRYYRITTTGEDAAKFKRLLAVSVPSAGGEYLSEKFNGFMKEAQVEVWVDNIRPTKSGVAADLIISVSGAAVKYSIYLWKEITLEFQSTDRSRVELAARLLKLAGVNTEVKKKMSNREVWRIWATTDMLAAGRKELRDALAKIVETARKSVGEEKAKRWLEKLKSGLTLMEGWPKYEMEHARSGAFIVRYRSINPDSIEDEARRFRAMGLVEGKHFTVKMPKGGRKGYISILRKGLERAAWLSVHGEGEQQKLAAAFVELILQRAEKACGGAERCTVYEKAKEIIEEGMSKGSIKLKGFEKEFEVDGKKYKVKVIDGEAVEEDRDGRKLLRIRITAEVGGVRSDYTITYGRSGRNNAAVSYTAARANAPGGREADAERFSALIKALTDEEPKVYRLKDGSIIMKCSKKHLDGFKRFAKLADAIEKWLEETSRHRGRASRT